MTDVSVMPYTDFKRSLTFIIYPGSVLFIIVGGEKRERKLVFEVEKEITQCVGYSVSGLSTVT